MGYFEYKYTSPIRDMLLSFTVRFFIKSRTCFSLQVDREFEGRRDADSD